VGEDVYIGPGCVIGYPAEHKKYWGKDSKFKVIIKDGAQITGMCTIDSGTVNDTVIGENCFIMKQTHIGHDAVLGNDCVISPHATIGGHCVLGDRVNFGMNSVIHQRAKVGNDCMIGMGTVITKKTATLDNMVFVGNPAHPLRANKT
jgi:UDP-N-acetylglucosamine acyltransferase